MSGRRLAATMVGVLLTMAALNVSTVHAAFTEEEAASILHAREATLSISRGNDNLAHMMNTYSMASTRPIFGAAMHQGGMASSEANAAITLLLNTIPAEPGTPGFAALAALSRAERLAQAWSRIDRAIMYSQLARKTLSAASRLRSDRPFQDMIRRAIEGWLTAIHHLSSVERGLRYASPNPPSFPQVVGPHGDYAGAQQMLWLAHAYAQNALMDLAEAYPATNLGTGSGDVFRRLSDTTDTIVNAMVLLAGVTWTQQQASLSPFFRTLDVLRALTDHARLPAMWRQVIFDLHPWKSSVALQTAVHQTDRITDAWMHSDGAAWKLMTFPDCSKLRDPQGCGGR
jgi:hypothetical protein